MKKSTKIGLQSAGDKGGEAIPLSPHDRIVSAALVCMEQRGIESTGIRDIAREAGVNSAAINYYFRSKDNLIRLAMEKSLEWTFGEIIDALDNLTRNGMPLNDALTDVFEAFAADLYRAPRLSYAHLRDALVDQRYDGPAVQQGNQFLSQLEERLALKNSNCDGEQLRLILVQLWSSLMMTALLPQLYDSFIPLQLDVKECRSRYVRQLLQPLFHFLASPA
ncbi:MAG: TetR/AcrR family transcriptional regulator [Deltaproteobacteria bacterium]|nr:TetR/AcrR family transcriptional regulator [Deltaproteobacteria bacterium]